MSIKQLKHTLNQLNIAPLKKWGQNFLINSQIIKQITDLVNDQPINNLVEIGPGLGAITKGIDFSKKYLVAVELDPTLAQYLQQDALLNHDRCQIINGDFLKFNVSEHYQQQHVMLYGNIPYNISSQIIKAFLHEGIYQQAILMVQAEYWHRLNAVFNTKAYGSWSVLVQTLCNLTWLLDVHHNNFYPIPQVDSVVFQLTKKPTNWSQKQINQYSWLVHQCFAMRRKTLVNNLKRIAHGNQLIDLLLKQGLIQPNIRPEQLSVVEYLAIFEVYWHLLNE